MTPRPRDSAFWATCLALLTWKAGLLNASLTIQDKDFEFISLWTNIPVDLLKSHQSRLGERISRKPGWPIPRRQTDQLSFSLLRRRSGPESGFNAAIFPAKRTLLAPEFKARKVTVLGRPVDEREGTGPEGPCRPASRHLQGDVRTSTILAPILFHR